MEITNKTLAWLVLAAIVVSFSGTIISLNKLGQGSTGYATSNSTGQATVTVQSQTILRFITPATMAFGTGSINTSGGYTQCNISVNTTAGTIDQTGCIGFSASTNPLILENAGTNLLNVTLNFSKDANNFIGGTGPLFQFTINNNETSSATPNATHVGWSNIINNTQIPVATNLNYMDNADSLLLGIKIGIPYDAPQASNTVDIIAQGTGN